MAVHGWTAISPATAHRAARASRERRRSLQAPGGVRRLDREAHSGASGLSPWHQGHQQVRVQQGAAGTGRANALTVPGHGSPHPVPAPVRAERNHRSPGCRSAAIFAGRPEQDARLRSPDWVPTAATPVGSLTQGDLPSTFRRCVRLHLNPAVAVRRPGYAPMGVAIPMPGWRHAWKPRRRRGEGPRSGPTFASLRMFRVPTADPGLNYAAST